MSFVTNEEEGIEIVREDVGVVFYVLQRCQYNNLFGFEDALFAWEPPVDGKVCMCVQGGMVGGGGGERKMIVEMLWNEEWQVGW